MVWYRAIASDIYFYLTVPQSPLSSYRKKERKGRKRKGREGGGSEYEPYLRTQRYADRATDGTPMRDELTGLASAQTPPK